jgi:hypothetical protein
MPPSGWISDRFSAIPGSRPTVRMRRKRRKRYLVRHVKDTVLVGGQRPHSGSGQLARCFGIPRESPNGDIQKQLPKLEEVKGASVLCSLPSRRKQSKRAPVAHCGRAIHIVLATLDETDQMFQATEFRADWQISDRANRNKS